MAEIISVKTYNEKYYAVRHALQNYNVIMICGECNSGKSYMVNKLTEEGFLNNSVKVVNEFSNNLLDDDSNKVLCVVNKLEHPEFFEYVLMFDGKYDKYTNEYV